MFLNERISSKQLFLLVFGQSIAMFIVIGQFASQNVGRDVWLSLLLAYIVGIGFGYIIFKLGKLYPDQTILEYLPKIWGKAIAIIISIIFVLNFTLLSVNVVRGPSGNIRTMYIETPVLYTMIFFAIMVCFTLYNGLETFVKANNFLAIMTILATTILLIGIYPELKFIRVLPIMENGISPVLNGTYTTLGIAINTALLIGIVLPHVHEKKGALKNIVLGFFCAGIFHALIAIAFIAFFNVEFLEQNVLYPLYNMMRYVYVAEFIFGFEVILMVIWVASTFFLYTGFLLPSIYGLFYLFKLREYRSLIIPFAALIIALTTLMPNPVYNIRIYLMINKTLSCALGLIIILSWIIALIKKKLPKRTKGV